MRLRRAAPEDLLLFVAADIVMWIYGSMSYTGFSDNTGDQVRAFVALGLFIVTIRLLRLWVRRRF
jgi:hypothetical protein